MGNVLHHLLPFSCVFRLSANPTFQDCALVVVVHDHLAPQAEDAFVRIDPAQRIDRTDGTLRFAEPALTSALRPAVEPVEELYLGGNSERGAQGTQVATEESLDKETCRQQAKSENDKRPVAHESAWRSPS